MKLLSATGILWLIISSATVFSQPVAYSFQADIESQAAGLECGSANGRLIGSLVYDSEATYQRNAFGGAIYSKDNSVSFISIICTDGVKLASPHTNPTNRFDVLMLGHLNSIVFNAENDTVSTLDGELAYAQMYLVFDEDIDNTLPAHYHPLAELHQASFL
ncbi:MAG: hypothetical protein V3T17_02755 [Pseudomonadales bacterium]